VSLLGNPSSTTASNAEDTSRGDDSTATIGFIQVCRNYLRYPSRVWKKQGFLEHLYKSGCAVYVYPDCKGVDLLASARIRVPGRKKLFIYVPILISVKARERLNKGERDDATKKMLEMLTDTESGGNDRKRKTEKLDEAKMLDESNGSEEANDTGALCILLMVGRNVKKGARDSLTVEQLSSLCTTNITLEIDIPAADCFGITNALHSMRGGEEMAEVYSSRAFLPYHNEEDFASEEALRLGPRKRGLGDEVVEVLKTLRKEWHYEKSDR